MILRKALVADGAGELLKFAFKSGLLPLIEKNVHYEYHVGSMIKKPYLLLLASSLLALPLPTKAFKYFL